MTARTTVQKTEPAVAVASPGSQARMVSGATPAHRDWLAIAARNVLILLARQGITKVLGLVGSVVVARLLFPADFGTYAVVGTVVYFFALFGDIGLGASLIQREEEPTDADIQVVFTLQQSLSVAAVAILFALAPLLVHVFHLQPRLVWMVRVLSLLLLVNSFRTLSGALLQRRLQYSRLCLVDFVAAATYQVAAVAMAVAGAGPWALMVALLLSYSAACVVSQMLAPWRVGLRWDWEQVRRHARFGLPFQGSATLAALELTAAPILLGLLAGTKAVGYVSLALTIVNLPLVLPQLVWTVGFPTMARLRGDRAELARSVRAMAKVNVYTASPLYLVLLIFGYQIVPLVYTSRWQPVVPLLDLFIWSWMLRLVAGTGIWALNAVGRSSVVFVFHLLTTGASWLLAVLLISRAGFLGIGVAWLLVAVPLPMIFLWTRQEVPIQVTRTLVLPLVPFGAVLGLTEVPGVPLGHVHGGLGSLLAQIAVTMALYCVLAVAVEWRHAVATAKRIMTFRMPRVVKG